VTHKLIGISIKIAWAICLLLLAGCPGKPTKEPAQTAKLERVPVEQIANLVDDLDADSLKRAIKQSLAFYERVPPERTYKLGHLQVRADLLKATLIEFLNLMNSGSLDSKTISKKFDVYRFRQAKEETNLFLTGYYEPILQGRLERNAEYRYPLYSVPPDLLTIDLNSFNPELYAGKTLRGRLVGKRVVPYFTRAEIDGQGKLDEQGCEMVWLQDLIDVFFLQIQGSGMIQLPAGKFVRVGYAASNGRPYRSIGKYLLNKGVMNREEISLQSIRAYLKAHPEVIDEVLWHNESYVFFRWVEEGPLGSLNVPLTGGRSIATDPEFFPRGGIAFLESEQPRLDGTGQVTAWEPLHRWVLNQDTGGAIKGSKRADLFCGSGERAEQIAGRLKHPGTIYFLIKKQAVAQPETS